MKINEIIEDVTKLSPGYKLDKLPHEEVEAPNTIMGKSR